MDGGNESRCGRDIECLRESDLRVIPASLWWQQRGVIHRASMVRPIVEIARGIHVQDI